MQFQRTAVDEFAVNVSVSEKPDRRLAQIVVFGKAHPGTEADNAWLLFHEGADAHLAPRYDELATRILIHFPLSQFAAIERILRNHKQEIWCHYREYDDGHRFADLHTGRLSTG